MTTEDSMVDDGVEICMYCKAFKELRSLANDTCHIGMCNHAKSDHFRHVLDVEHPACEHGIEVEIRD